MLQKGRSFQVIVEQIVPVGTEIEIYAVWFLDSYLSSSSYNYFAKTDLPGYSQIPIEVGPIVAGNMRNPYINFGLAEPCLAISSPLH